MTKDNVRYVFSNILLTLAVVAPIGLTMLLISFLG